LRRAKRGGTTSLLPAVFFCGARPRRIPSAPLLPENDPTVLFTTAGMHPLVPYLLGEPHPLGRRLVNVQKCIRTNDIEEVGDTSHLTFFEMLGNWSLGDYFKPNRWPGATSFSPASWAIDPRRLAVTVFAGDETARVTKKRPASGAAGHSRRSASFSCPVRTTGGGRSAPAAHADRIRRCSTTPAYRITPAAGPAARAASGSRSGTTCSWNTTAPLRGTT
jgi:hypothetical protein